MSCTCRKGARCDECMGRDRVAKLSPFPRPALESVEKSLWPDREIPGAPADILFDRDPGDEDASA